MVLSKNWLNVLLINVLDKSQLYFRKQNNWNYVIFGNSIAHGTKTIYCALIKFTVKNINDPLEFGRGLS
jgi:hypothetical protein